MSDSKSELHNFQYYVVPTNRNHHSSYGTLQNNIFDYWAEQWTNNFKKSNPKPGWQDHFLRMSLATAIGYKNQIIGCLLFRFHHLAAHPSQQSEYFSYFEKSLIPKMSQDGFNDAMSVEYLSIDPTWSKNSMNVSLGKVIITLSAYVAEFHGMDGIISTPICGTKVDKMLENIGAFAVQENIKKYGYTLKLMVAKTKPATKSIDQNIKLITDYLWENRTDYSIDNTASKKAA